jgi:hypothetical protein
MDLLYSRLVKKNVAPRNLMQELSRFNDFLTNRFDASKNYVLFDSLYFA